MWFESFTHLDEVTNLVNFVIAGLILKGNKLTKQLDPLMDFDIKLLDSFIFEDIYIYFLRYILVKLYKIFHRK